MGRYDGIEELEPDTKGAGLRVGIVMGRFNIDVGDGLLSSCTAGLVKHGVAQKDMRIVTVPGALEIPLTLKKMAQSGKYDALIALGAVIRGETYHFEIVSNESSRGIADRWSLERLFEPEMSDDQRETLYDGWLNAVAAARSLPPAS